MLHISAEFLSLSGEPAVLVKQDRIVFINSAAEGILGSGCIGRSPGMVFGAELAGTNCSSFICDIMIDGVCYIARVASADNMKAIFFSRREFPAALLSDAFVYSIRNRLMSFAVAADIARQRAETLGDEEMLVNIAAMTQEYFRARRSVSNISIIRGVHDKSIYPSVSRFDLREMLSGLVEILSSMVNDVAISLSDGPPISVTGDSALIEQLVLNLISNAITHAQGRTHIVVGIRETGSHAIISVSDDGCGIPPDKLHLVFDRYRHGYDMSNIGAGAGFGLTVARSIAQLHGGTLLLESRQGVGTTVRVSISHECGFAAFGEPGTMWTPSISPVLIGLADCLDTKYFSEKFTD